MVKPIHANSLQYIAADTSTHRKLLLSFPLPCRVLLSKDDLKSIVRQIQAIQPDGLVIIIPFLFHLRFPIDKIQKCFNAIFPVG